MRSLWNHCRGAASIVCLGLLAGCCTTDPTPKKTAVTDPAPKRADDDDPLAKQARQLRANSSEDRGTGLCDKSREIENDLGYR